MTNADRAAQLAQIFGWPVRQCPSGCVHVETPFGQIELAYLVDWDSGLLYFLLRELTRRGHSVEIEGLDAEAEWLATVDTREGKRFSATNEDVLIALVDAVLAAHEGGTK